MSVVIFDATCTQPLRRGTRFHGAGSYAERLLIELTRGKDPDKRLDILVDPARPLPAAVQDLVDKETVGVHEARRNYEALTLMQRIRPDKFIMPQLQAYLPYINELSRAAECTLIMHDVRMLQVINTPGMHRYIRDLRGAVSFLWKTLFPGLEYRRKLARYSQVMNNQDIKIVTVSEYSKYSILKHLKIPEEQIRVRYSPKSDPEGTYRATTAFPLEPEIKQEGFFLVVSAARWMKNAYLATRAFQNSRIAENYGIKLVLAGADEKQKKDFENKTSIVALKEVEPWQLEKMYAQAKALIFPSFAEGFGYPPLEAMRHGTPVLSSSSSAMPEILGEDALYFNPYSPEELEVRMLQIIRDRTLYERYSRKSRQRYLAVGKIQDYHLNLLAREILE